jgi:Phage portal protein
MPDVNTGKMTAINPGVIARMTQGARDALKAINNAWFGPWQPLQPLAPTDPQAGVVGRQYDYENGLNLNYVPRSTEPIDFDTLRALANNCDVLRAVIEARKDLLSGLDWVIRTRNLDDGAPSQVAVPRPKRTKSGQVVNAINSGASADQLERIKNITDFLQYPDRENSWDQWSRALHEEKFVIDAATVYRRRTRGGKLYALELMDGATIKPLITATGRRPVSPDPAFQQVLHGIPAVNYTREELLYMPKNVRVNHLYGYGPVEQILVTVNTAIRRSVFQLEFYREGSTPDAWVGLPPEWNLTQVKQFQKYMDSLLSGQLGERRKVRFMPGNFKYQETKPFDLKDMYDEWLARIICFTFSVSPEPFVQHISRSSGQTSRNRALEEGLLPDQRWFKQLVDRVIREDFGSTDLEFVYLEDREQDPSAQANIDVAYAKGAIKAIDEVRELRGLDPLGGAYSRPMLATAQGYIEPGKLTSEVAAEAQAELGLGGDQPAGDKAAGESSDESGTRDAPSEPDRSGVKQTPGDKPMKKSVYAEIVDAVRGNP